MFGLNMAVQITSVSCFIVSLITGIFVPSMFWFSHCDLLKREVINYFLHLLKWINMNSCTIMRVQLSSGTYFTCPWMGCECSKAMAMPFPQNKTDKTDNGRGLHDDGKFWDCRTSGQFPNWNFVHLSSLVVKCSGCSGCGFNPQARHLWQVTAIVALSTLKNVLDLSILHRYLNKINN